MEESKLRRLIREEAKQVLFEQVDEEIFDYAPGVGYYLEIVGFDSTRLNRLEIVKTGGSYALVAQGRPANYPFSINPPDFEKAEQTLEVFDYVYEIQVLSDGQVRVMFGGLSKQIDDAFPPKYFIDAPKL